MFSKKLEKAFNRQLNRELFSSYLYLSMSAALEAQNLKGMAAWMRLQAQEELMHSMKFYDFINGRGGRVVLAGLEDPETEWGSPLAVFEHTYEHECKVTGMINDLTDLAISEKDHAAVAFLQWFVTEQVEEEASVKEIADKLKLADGHSGSLFMLDKELGQRTPAPAE
ncbi:MAG: ferritin [Gemmatimonadota bacterium]|nr:ferritin [Gemmatimonadota bacterium]